MICTTGSHFWLWSGAGSAPSAPDHIRCQCGQYTAREWRTLEAENVRLTARLAALTAERDAIRKILEADDSEDTVTVVRQEMAELRHWEQEIPRCQAEIEQVKAERDALAARLAAAEAALRRAERLARGAFDHDMDHCAICCLRTGHRPDCPFAALADSREQAAGEGEGV